MKMTLGDIPLKHLKPGICLLGENATEGILIFHNKGWSIKWDNGNISHLGQIDDKHLYDHIEVKIVGFQIALDKDYLV